MQVKNIRTSLIQRGNNDRTEFNQTALQELADSIQANGLAQPITVRVTSHNPKRYTIVAGERRFRAISQILGKKTIPAIVRELTDKEASAIMLIENLSRVDINPVDEANAFQKRLVPDQVGGDWTIGELAEKTGRTPDYIRRRLGLLSLRQNLQELVSLGQFPIGHAELITDLEPEYQQLAAKVYERSKGMSLSHFGDVVADLRQQQTAENATPLFDLEAYWLEVADDMAQSPRRGKNAVVPVPTRNDLPEVTTESTDNTAKIILRYVRKLENSGLSAEAGAVGNLLTALVHGNFASVPDGA